MRPSDSITSSVVSAGDAGERVAAEGGAVVAGVEHAGGRAACQAGADWHTVAEPLRGGQHVGHDRRVCWNANIAPVRPLPVCTSSSINSQPFLLVAQRAQALQVALGRDADAGLALDRFHQHRDDAAVVARDVRELLEFTETCAHEAAHQRLETGLHLAAAGGGQRGQRAAVEGILHHDDRGLLDVPTVAVHARDLDRAFVGLGAGVAEEHVIHAAQRDEAVGDAASASTMR
jgi:hypothetical protein